MITESTVTEARDKLARLNQHQQNMLAALMRWESEMAVSLSSEMFTMPGADAMIRIIINAEISAVEEAKRELLKELNEEARRDG